MAKADFEKFVRNQKQAALVEDVGIDWDKQRDEWLGYLDQLYKQIESFLEQYVAAKEAFVTYQPMMLNEENIGTYPVRKMLIRFGGQEVTLTPIGTLLIAMKGRVDVLGPAGQSRLFLVNKKAASARSLIHVTVNIVGRPSPPPEPAPTGPIEWAWKIASPPPEMKFVELNQDAFFEMILEVVNA